MIKAGDKLPDATVFGPTPGDKLSTAELFKGKKAVLFGGL